MELMAFSFLNSERKQMEYNDLRSIEYKEMLELMENIGEKTFRGKQIYEWLHKKLAVSYDEMSNIPKSLREKLAKDYVIASVTKVDMQESKIDGTRKYLFRLKDGNLIESVFMRYEHGNSVCVSSQVGCRMGCRFCASTIDGLVRNLLPGEILGQIYSITKDVNEKISNVVIMGSGEPLDNYDNVLKFIKMLNHEQGLNISQRNITLSTCGIVEKIIALADEELQITLALSLHAPNDLRRRELMPIANKYELKDVIGACSYYFEKTGRRLTFEYSLVGGVNDSKEEVYELINLIKGLNCHVNLIPVNPIKERDFVQSTMEVVTSFKNILEKNHINVTIRREMGRDIDGACGQLRRSYMDSVDR